MLKMKKDKQVNTRKTSLLKLDGVVLKKPLSMSLRSTFFFYSKTHDTMSGQSVAVCPGKKL